MYRDWYLQAAIENILVGASLGPLHLACSIIEYSVSTFDQYFPA